jgi:hypothetical protein
MVGFDVLAPVLSVRQRLHIADAQVPRQRLTIAAFDQWGNIATSFNGRLEMTFSYSLLNGGVPGDLPETLDLVGGTAAYDVTWPTQADGDVVVLMRGRYGTSFFLDPPRRDDGGRETAARRDQPRKPARVGTTRDHRARESARGRAAAPTRLSASRTRAGA